MLAVLLIVGFKQEAIIAQTTDTIKHNGVRTKKNSDTGLVTPVNLPPIGDNVVEVLQAAKNIKRYGDSAVTFTLQNGSEAKTYTTDVIKLPGQSIFYMKMSNKDGEPRYIQFFPFKDDNEVLRFQVTDKTQYPEEIINDLYKKFERQYKKDQKKLHPDSSPGR